MNSTKPIPIEGMRKKFLQSRQLVVLAYLFFLILNFVYLNVFALHKEKLEDNANFGNYFNFPLNTDEDKGSIPEMHMIEEGENRGLTNVTGIAFFYLFLKQIFGFSYEDLPLVSFIINNLVILFSYYYFVKIGLQLGLSMSYRWLFFMNPALIYYSQLINKEILTLLFILVFTYYLGRRQYLKLLISSFCSIFIRMQLGGVGFFSLLLYTRRRYLLCLLLFYVFTSVAGTRIFAVNLAEVREALEKPGGGMGFVMLTQILNQKYYIGSLLLNPVKTIQYLYDLFKSIFFITSDNRINLYRLRDLPFVLALICFARPLTKIFFNFKKYQYTDCRPLFTVTITYFIVLLIHPVVHARYLFPISYNILLLAAFASLHLKGAIRKRQLPKAIPLAAHS